MQVRTMADVGALLREAREDAGLTQIDLARQARVSREWLLKVEAGRTSAELPRVMAVLAVLGLVLDIRKQDEQDS